jgi:hypothetical protein
MKTTGENHGASPLPKGKRKLGTLYKKPAKKKEGPRDPTGQTDTSLRRMKQRLREVPKRSAATAHDKKAYE